MWYAICLLLLILLVGSPRADVQCDGIDDLLTQALSLDNFIFADTWTITAYFNSTGSTFGGSNCWNGGPFLVDTNAFLAIGRGTGTGDACVQAYGSGTMQSWPSRWAGTILPPASVLEPRPFLSMACLSPAREVRRLRI